MNRRGFTFIELITVWAIIAILAAILFPVFAKAREKARQCACLQNLHNIGAAMRMYAADNHGHFPPVNNDFSQILPRYLPDRAALVCPTLHGLKPFEYPPPSPDELLRRASHYDYVYQAGRADDDSPQEVLASDVLNDLHNGGANYLWVDGRAKWLNQGVSSSGGPTGDYVGQNVQIMDQLRVARSGRAYLKAPEPPRGYSDE
ncbi:MAG: DUF1559 domain-containing protein [Armatimonadia bacterium]